MHPTQQKCFQRKAQKSSSIARHALIFHEQTVQSCLKGPEGESAQPSPGGPGSQYRVGLLAQVPRQILSAPPWPRRQLLANFRSSLVGHYSAAACACTSMLVQATAAAQPGKVWSSPWSATSVEASTSDRKPRTQCLTGFAESRCRQQGGTNLCGRLDSSAKAWKTLPVGEYGDVWSSRNLRPVWHSQIFAASSLSTAASEPKHNQDPGSSRQTQPNKGAARQKSKADSPQGKKAAPKKGMTATLH